jgi:pyruvate/2-oxoglutarate dehydrogenase complex dihydrolipoamide acyltransferase (E2) component
MGVNARSKILPWLLAASAAVVLVLVLAGVFRTEPSTDDASGQTPRAGVPMRNAPAPEPRAEAAPPVPAASNAPGLPSEPAAEAAPASAPGRHPVDLQKLRELLPNNLYWETSVPTKDPEVLRKREEEGRRWNELYGKVQSNTATEQEIHQYYEHRRQVSEDAIAFASKVLEQYGAQLPEQEQGLYALSIRMHRTRLEELPRRIEEALARKSAHDQRREAWRGNGGN